MAEALYLSNYEDGWEGMGGITEMSPDEFKVWVKDEKQTGKPLYRERIEDVSHRSDPKKGGDPEQKGRSDSRAQAINDFVETIVAPDLKKSP